METRIVNVDIRHAKTGVLIYRKDFEVPSTWSDTAARIMASRYALDEETSAFQVVDRVVNQITKWGQEQGYFKNETEEANFFRYLKSILLAQRAAFNTPVWLNVGALNKNPQVSACFVMDVEDNMEDIFDHVKRESKVFKDGSGVGINISKLRARGEKLSGGGTSSGPLSFMKVYDATAKCVKSGGRNRRAAKMVIMNDNHPDLFDFINCKKEEEKKSKILINNGISPEEAKETVSFQEENHSILVTDSFMIAVKNNSDWFLTGRVDSSVHKRVKARDILLEAAKACWYCGDPGLIFYDTINKDNPVQSLGPITGSNPCGEFLFPIWGSCNLASLNIKKYLDKSGSINLKLLEHDVSVLVTAMDIMIDKAYYPEEKVKELTIATRPLGLGFTNLGAALLELNFAYDSEQARTFARYFAQKMNEYAIYQSEKLAKRLGSFEKWNNYGNKQSIKDRIRRKLGIDIDIDEIRNSQLTLVAPTGCLNKETSILTSKGIIEIGSLGNISGELWQDINVDILQEFNSEKVSKFYNNGIQNTIKIVTEDGYNIEGTLNHKIRILTNSGEYLWKRLDELTKSDIIIIKSGGHEKLLENKNLIKLKTDFIQNNRAKQYKIPEYMDEKLAWILGLYMSDGCLHRTKEKSSGIRFFLHRSELEIGEKLKQYLYEVFNLECKVTKSLKSNHTLYEINSINIANFFISNNFVKNKGNHGEGAESAHIPKQILESKTSVLCAFINGIFDGDGTLNNCSINNQNSVLEFCTVSSKLANQLQVALLSLNIRTKLTSRIYKGCYGSRRKYRLRIKNKLDLKTYYEKIGITEQAQKEQLQNLEIKEYKGVGIFCKKAWEELWEFRNDIFYLDGCRLSFCKNQGCGTFAFAKYLIDNYNFLENTLLSKLVKMNIFTQSIKSIENTNCYTVDISVPEKNTYIAGGFISHNTISLIMDCETTGIEPYFSLETIKTYSDGSTSILENSTKDKDKSVLKCANDIHYKDHIDMMASVQSVIDSGISKTVNMPNDCTVEDIYNAFIYAWEKGLKAISIYRDGSKNLQPLKKVEDSKTTINKEDKIELKDTKETPVRKKLSETRNSLTHKFDISGFEGYFTLGLYDDGSIGEIFIVASKGGSTMQGILDSFATAISLCLQYGVPIDKLIDKYRNASYDPAGFTASQDIPRCKSIVDYIFRWIEKRFIAKEVETEPGIEEKLFTFSDKQVTMKLDGPPCMSCGGITVKTGTCFTCTTCGITTGCA